MEDSRRFICDMEMIYSNIKDLKITEFLVKLAKNEQFLVKEYKIMVDKSKNKDYFGFASNLGLVFRKIFLNAPYSCSSSNSFSNFRLKQINSEDNSMQDVMDVIIGVSNGISNKDFTQTLEKCESIDFNVV